MIKNLLISICFICLFSSMTFAGRMVCTVTSVNSTNVTMTCDNTKGIKKDSKVKVMYRSKKRNTGIEGC